MSNNLAQSRQAAKKTRNRGSPTAKVFRAPPQTFEVAENLEGGGGIYLTMATLDRIEKVTETPFFEDTYHGGYIYVRIKNIDDWSFFGWMAFYGLGNGSGTKYGNRNVCDGVILGTRRPVRES